MEKDKNQGPLRCVHCCRECLMKHFAKEGHDESEAQILTEELIKKHFPDAPPRRNV
jgi:hypothetical protein